MNTTIITSELPQAEPPQEPTPQTDTALALAVATGAAIAQSDQAEAAAQDAEQTAQQLAVALDDHANSDRSYWSRVDSLEMGLQEIRQQLTEIRDTLAAPEMEEPAVIEVAAETVAEEPAVKWSRYKRVQSR